MKEYSIEEVDSTFRIVSKKSPGNHTRTYKYVIGILQAKTKDTISFKLKNDLNKDVGANLELSHKILKGDGEAFLRFLKSKQESAILAGSDWRW